MAGLYDAADELIAMSVDGKTQRGTAHGQVRARHRLGAMLSAGRRKPSSFVGVML
jgi:hypothetical protein